MELNMTMTQQRTLTFGFRKSYLNTLKEDQLPTKSGERKFLKRISKSQKGHDFEKTIDIDGVRNYIYNFNGVLVECDAYCPNTKTITEIKMNQMASAKGDAALIMALSHLTGAGIKRVKCVTSKETLVVDSSFYRDVHLDKAKSLLKKVERFYNKEVL